MSPDQNKIVDTSGLSHFSIDPIFKKEWWIDPIPYSWIWEHIRPEVRPGLLNAIMEAETARAKIRVEEANIRLNLQAKLEKLARE